MLKSQPEPELEPKIRCLELKPEIWILIPQPWLWQTSGYAVGKKLFMQCRIRHSVNHASNVSCFGVISTPIYNRLFVFVKFGKYNIIQASLPWSRTDQVWCTGCETLVIVICEEFPVFQLARVLLRCQVWCRSQTCLDVKHTCGLN